jgi:hypothetical protein
VGKLDFGGENIYPSQEFVIMFTLAKFMKRKQVIFCFLALYFFLSKTPDKTFAASNNEMMICVPYNPYLQHHPHVLCLSIGNMVGYLIYWGIV